MIHIGLVNENIRSIYSPRSCMLVVARQTEDIPCTVRIGNE